MYKSIVIAIALLFTCSGFAQPVQQHGELKVVGTQLKDKSGQSIVLRGMSFGWHNWWSKYYTEGAVKWLASDWKCNVVRAAMGIEPEGGYLQNKEASLSAIKTVVDAAIKANIYVIVDWHSHNINFEEAKEFFAEIAKKYGTNPHIIYEIFNEPDYESWQDVKKYSIELIKTIRAIDPDNIILIGSPHWDQDINLAANDPIKGFENIMYSMHYYAGTHKQWLRDRTDEAIQKGLPIFISECAGMEATGDGPLNMDEWQAWIEWAEERKISWITWSVSAKKEACSVLLPDADPQGGWQETQLRESGILSRKFIRKYNSN
jgi:endoglucanase